MPGRFSRVVVLGATLTLATAGEGRAASRDAASPDALVAATPVPDLPFEAEIRAFEAADRKRTPKPGPVVFIGSSSIRLWDSVARDFPRYPVLNRGFGGSHVADSVRYVHRIVVPYRPRLVVMYAGTNDIDAGKTPEAVAADFQAFTARIWADLPRTEIAFISIAPNPARWAEVERVREANRLIERTCAADPRLHFIDVFPRMLGRDGQPRPELFIEDRLHMNRKGYEVWIPPIRATLDAVLQPRPPVRPR
jgi:lysophospholipase L1-like esterase